MVWSKNFLEFLNGFWDFKIEKKQLFRCKIFEDGRTGEIDIFEKTISDICFIYVGNEDRKISIIFRWISSAFFSQPGLVVTCLSKPRLTRLT